MKFKFKTDMKQFLNWHYKHVMENHSNNRYHNITHAFNVMQNAMECCHDMGVDKSNELILASIYHDFIYVPGRKDNEIKSADYLLSIEPSMTIASEWIKSTSVESHLSDYVTFENNPELSILMDSDLCSLAQSPMGFISTQKSILMENKRKHSDLYLSANFLENLRAKGFIYRTPHFRDKYEEKAQSNISWLTLITQYEIKNIT